MTGMDDPKASILQALGQDCKEWFIPTDTSAEMSTSGGSSAGPSGERLGIASLHVFLLSLASDSRLPLAADISKLVSSLYAFAQSRRITILGVITEFKNEHSTGDNLRELLLWSLTSRAASKLAAFRKVDDDWDFVWKLQGMALYRAKLGLEPWDDCEYDPDHILDRKKPLRKARMSSSTAYSEEHFAEENTWRRVWTLKHKGTDRERLAKCIIEIVKEVAI